MFDKGGQRLFGNVNYLGISDLILELAVRSAIDNYLATYLRIHLHFPMSDTCAGIG